MGKPNIIFYFTDQQRHDTLDAMVRSWISALTWMRWQRRAFFLRRPIQPSRCAGHAGRFFRQDSIPQQSTVFAMRSLFPCM